MVISSRAKIANDSVLSLHHQLKSSRDQMRMEQAATVRQLQVHTFDTEHFVQNLTCVCVQTSGASDNELLVGHTEAQKRLISTLEKHVDTLVEQHQHLLERTKQKQVRFTYISNSYLTYHMLISYATYHM